MPKSRLSIGDRVCVKFGVLSPRYGWGGVSPGDVGTIASIDGKDCRVAFPKNKEWRGVLGEMEPVIMADSAPEGVLDMYEDLFVNKHFQDVTFVLQDGEEGAHRAMLAAASGVFAAMFSQSMREGRAGRVELADIKRASMRVFLRLLYTGHVDPQDWREEVQSARSSPVGAGGGGGGRDSEEEKDEYEDQEENAEDPDHNDDEEVFGDGHRGGADVEDENEYADVLDDEATRGAQAADKEDPELPLGTLVEVAYLAHRYMVQNVLQLAIEALKSRLHKAVVAQNAAAFEEILGAAIRTDIGGLRMAALEVVKKSRAMRSKYEAKKFRPEVQLELQALWPPPPPCKAKRALLA